MKTGQLRLVWPVGLLLWELIAPNPSNGQSTNQLSSIADSIKTYRATIATRYSTGVSAHRGNSQLAPENTLATFQEALKMQVDYIEIDVRTTQDGQLVILHDGNLNRTTTGTGPVND